jgi:hypothetical protein
MRLHRYTIAAKPISLVSALVLVASTFFASTVLFSSQSALAAPVGRATSTVTTLCLSNHKSYCAGIKGSVNKAGAAIWLGRASGHKNFRWVEVLIPTCSTGICYNFEDSQDTKLCLSATHKSQAYVRLEGCNVGLAGWYNEGSGELGNEYWAANGNLAVRDPVKNGRYVEALNTGTKHIDEKWNY